MGQKVNPHGLRIGIIKDWDTKWYANDKNFGDFLVEDNKIRKYIKNKLYISGVSRIEIERAANKIKVNVHQPSPSCNRKKVEPERIRRKLKSFTGRAF